jgi:hypothetical protein
LRLTSISVDFDLKFLSAWDHEGMSFPRVIFEVEGLCPDAWRMKGAEVDFASQRVYPKR